MTNACPIDRRSKVETLGRSAISKLSLERGNFRHLLSRSRNASRDRTRQFRDRPPELSSSSPLLPRIRAAIRVLRRIRRRYSSSCCPTSGNSDNHRVEISNVFQISRREAFERSFVSLIGSPFTADRAPIKSSTYLFL